jgi:hypothetical protein
MKQRLAPKSPPDFVKDEKLFQKALVWLIPFLANGRNRIDRLTLGLTPAAFAAWKADLAEEKSLGESFRQAVSLTGIISSPKEWRAWAARLRDRRTWQTEIYKCVEEMLALVLLPSLSHSSAMRVMAAAQRATSERIKARAISVSPQALLGSLGTQICSIFDVMAEEYLDIAISLRSYLEALPTFIQRNTCIICLCELSRLSGREISEVNSAMHRLKVATGAPGPAIKTDHGKTLADLLLHRTFHWRSEAMNREASNTFKKRRSNPNRRSSRVKSVTPRAVSVVTKARVKVEAPSADTRELRLQAFLGGKISVATVRRTARVAKANMQQWRRGELSSDSVMSKRIEDVLSGKTPLDT